MSFSPVKAISFVFFCAIRVGALFFSLQYLGFKERLFLLTFYIFRLFYLINIKLRFRSVFDESARFLSAQILRETLSP